MANWLKVTLFYVLPILIILAHHNQLQISAHFRVCPCSCDCCPTTVETTTEDCGDDDSTTMTTTTEDCGDDDSTTSSTTMTTTTEDCGDDDSTTSSTTTTTTTSTTPTSTTTTEDPSCESTTTTTTTTTTTSTTTTTTSTTTTSCCGDGEWSGWMSMTDCTATCGSCGVQTFQRTCLSASTCPCKGVSNITIPCGRSPCTYPNKSCCGNYAAVGTKYGVFCNSTGLSSNSSNYKCGATNSSCCGQWGDWMEISTCSNTCGSCGEQTYARTCLTASTCPCTGPSSIAIPCLRSPCTYPAKSCCSPYGIAGTTYGIFCGSSPELPASSC